MVVVYRAVRRLLVLAAVCGIWTVCPVAAQAAQVIGPDQSLERTVQAARPGGTVLLRSGTYPRLDVPAGARLGGVTVRPARGATVRLGGVRIGLHGGGLRVQGLRVTDVSELDDVRQVAFVGNDFSSHGIVGSGRRLLFEGNAFHDLTIHRNPAVKAVRCNTLSSNAGIYPRCGTALRLYRSVDVVVRANRFQRIPTDGLQLLEMRDTLIEGNLFEDISAFIDPYEHSDSIQMLGDSDRVTVRRNFFHRARGLLAQPFNGRGAQRRLVIENNVAVRLRHWAFNLYDAPGARVTGNTIWDTGGRGIALADYGPDPTPMTGAVVANNIVGVLHAEPQTMAFEDYNMVGEGTHGGPHDRTVPRPLFADPDRSDYRLVHGSPAIDGALAGLAETTDIRGAQHVRAPDIGAYEYGAALRWRSPFPGLGSFGPVLPDQRRKPPTRAVEAGASGRR